MPANARPCLMVHASFARTSGDCQLHGAENLPDPFYRILPPPPTSCRTTSTERVLECHPPNECPHALRRAAVPPGASPSRAVRMNAALMHDRAPLLAGARRASVVPAALAPCQAGLF